MNERRKTGQALKPASYGNMPCFLPRSGGGHRFRRACETLEDPSDLSSQEIADAIASKLNVNYIAFGEILTWSFKILKSGSSAVRAKIRMRLFDARGPSLIFVGAKELEIKLVDKKRPMELENALIEEVAEGLAGFFADPREDTEP